ncbi:MAG: Hpt domain-containing protein [Stenotrophobium sp.]
MSILRVEHSLDDALFHQLQFDAGANVRRPELEDSVPHSRDLAEGRAALLREAMVNLARFKTSTDAYVRGAESAMAAEAPRLLTEISSAFHILQIERASTLVAQLERYVRSTGFAEVRTNGERAERFADAVALVEYYLEDAGRGGIAQAESLLDRLAGYVEELEIAEEPAAAVEAQVAEILGTEPQAALPPEAFTAPEEPVPSSPAEPQAPPPVDPEIRDIFLDEAAEVRAELERALPYLRRDAQDKEQLTVVRRAFHTLKGSGRMVGAGHVGDFGWALESMLNHCLDGSISTSPEVVEVVGEAVALLPGLIEGFRNGEPPDVRIGPLMEHARNIARGRTAAEEASGMAAIFREDALEKLGSVMRWLRRQHPDQGEYEVNDEVVRAFHTLRGAAHVVRAPAISELSGALETYLDSTRGAGLALPQKALDLLDSASGTLRDWVEAVGSPAVQMQDSSSWLERIREVQSQVPEQAVQASADRELAEIFSSEALDLVQKIEQTAGAWSRAPQNLQAAGDIKTLCHTLQGAALMSKCRPLADVARGLHARMDRAIREEHALPAEFFGETSGVIESMYQLLDRYREGSLTDETAAQIVHAFEAERPSAAHAGGGAEPDAAAEIPPAAQPEPDEALIEMLPVADVPWNEDGAPLSDGDGELRAIFVGEAYELLESLDGHAAAWERQPGSTESGNEIKRVLHTLKGSARMAGFPGIGEVSQHLESRVAEALYAGTGDHALFAQLQQGSDGLHRMLLDFEQGRLPDAAGLITALDAVVEQGTEPVSLSVQQAALPETPPSRIEFDPDLAEVFAGEAGELIESMQASLTAWRQHPDDAAHGREMLRALHTLKGGAHMAGLQDMGNAAHNMESLIEAMEQQGSAGAAALDSLAADLEGLQHLHDRLVRGDTAGQHVVPEAAPVPAASFDDHDELAVTAGKPAQTAIAVPAGWSPQLFWKPEEDAGGLAAMRRETARVPVESLDSMLNQAGEISIYRSRMEEQSTTLQTQLGELAQAITRLREQLRMLDIETEAQIAARGMGHAGTQHDRYSEHFDPLEMDRFTRMQELSRALAESVGDLSALHATMDQLEGEADTLLLQQGRINTELQQGLMRTLMVPFSRQVARLQRVVRQVAQDNGKQVEAQFNGIESELDRNVLERMTAPLEHLLRNAVVHGIGTAEQRIAVGKPAGGTVTVSLRREGTQLLIEVRDDGQGLNLDAIRATAVKRGLMPEDARISDDEVAQFIFEPGFSTAGKLTKDAGRGVGMDVVAAQVRQLGGTLELGSERGRGARFLIRLPLNLAISQALLVTVGAEMYAIPLTSIEGIARIPHEQIDSLRGESGTLYNYGGHDYRMNYLGDFIGTQHDLPEDSKTVTAILVRIGEGIGAQERRVGVFVDALQGNREIVSKSVGPQLSTVTGVSGATILADGRVVLILDIVALTLDRTRRALISLAAGKAESATAGGDTRDLVMVVDDSITIRRVTERLLLKNGYRVVTAKDGLDAMAQLQTEHPAAVLLDIEMPRADGFEVATFIRNSERIGKLPIIMITSRSGDKHRERAAQIGVNRYLIKPFQEEQLMGEVRDVIREAAL